MGLCHWFFLNPPWSTEKVQGSWGQVGASGLQLSLTFFVSQISPQHLPFPGGAHTPPQRPLLFPRMCPREEWRCADPGQRVAGLHPRFVFCTENRTFSLLGGFCGHIPGRVSRLEQWGEPRVAGRERPAFQEVRRGPQEHSLYPDWCLCSCVDTSM
uniref:Uncharacterized protein n=1 Tax=Balaenoptera musculus TaxID=9771 RepID=A0A8C0DWZ8_BALMU